MGNNLTAGTNDRDGKRAGDTIRYANCGYHCFRNCILKVRVREGVIVSVEPDDTINTDILREDEHVSEKMLNKGR